MLDALQLLDAKAGDGSSSLIPLQAIASLYRLVVRVLGQASDLSELAGSPREWIMEWMWVSVRVTLTVKVFSTQQNFRGKIILELD